MLKSNFRLHLINRWRFARKEPTSLFTFFVYLECFCPFSFLLFAFCWKSLEWTDEVVLKELKLKKWVILTKATWRAIHHPLMEKSCVNVRKENGGVNFAFCFSTKIRFKKENGRLTKAKEHEVNVLLSTSKQPPEKNS